MSVLRTDVPAPPSEVPRVRDLARQAVARMVFSATASFTVAASLLLLAYAVGR
jgi:hypothetical protein